MTRPAATAIPITSRCTTSGRGPAELAATPVVLQATVDRRLLLRVLRAAQARSPGRCGYPATSIRPGSTRAYTAHDELTHRVDVRRYIGAKRAAMAGPRQPGQTAPTSAPAP